MVIPSRACTSGRPLDYKCTGTYIDAYTSLSLTHTDVLQQSQKCSVNMHFAVPTGRER